MKIEQIVMPGLTAVCAVCYSTPYIWFPILAIELAFIDGTDIAKDGDAITKIGINIVKLGYMWVQCAIIYGLLFFGLMIFNIKIYDGNFVHPTNILTNIIAHVLLYVKLYNPKSFYGFRNN